MALEVPGLEADGVNGDNGNFFQAIALRTWHGSSIRLETALSVTHAGCDVIAHWRRNWPWRSSHHARPVWQ